MTLRELIERAYDGGPDQIETDIRKEFVFIEKETFKKFEQKRED